MQDHKKIDGDDALTERASSPFRYPIWLVPLELVIASGVAFTTIVVSGPTDNLIIFPVGGLVGLMFLILVLCIRHLPIRLGIDFAAVLFVFFGFVLPDHYRQMQREAEKQQYAKELKAENEASEIKRNAWIAEMKQSGNHGLPGVMPPMLKVEDDGIVVHLMNNSDQKVIVALARIREDSSSPGGWKGCGMRPANNDDPKSGGGYYTFVSPGKTRVFIPNTPCGLSFRGAAIEYRVGHRPPEIGWWSDSAFAKPEGRETDEVR